MSDQREDYYNAMKGSNNGFIYTCPSCKTGYFLSAAAEPPWFTACPKCGHLVAAAGMETLLEKQRELQQDADKATADLRMELKGAKNFNEYLNLQNIEIAKEIGELRAELEAVKADLSTCQDGNIDLLTENHDLKKQVYALRVELDKANTRVMQIQLSEKGRVIIRAERAEAEVQRLRNLLEDRR